MVRLAFVVAVVAALLIVVVVSTAFQVAIMLLYLLVCPGLHHVTEFHDDLGEFSSKVPVDVTLEDAVVEVVHHVLI